MMDLVVGAFYWVVPANDPDEDIEQLTDTQPALFVGYSESGEQQWICLGLEGLTTWPMKWIGAIIYAPIS
jgi:hypothetical protein